METEFKRPAVQNGITGLLAVAACAALLLTMVYYQKKPIRNAAKIRKGDSSVRVHELLGTPTQVFQSDADLRASRLSPMSFVYSKKNVVMIDTPLSKLPTVTTHAEWFEYSPTAGHLVYYDEEGVEIVFWGGT